TREVPKCVPCHLTFANKHATRSRTHERGTQGVPPPKATTVLFAGAGGIALRNVGLVGTMFSLTKSRVNPSILPSMYIRLTMFRPIEKSLPGLMTTLPWMKAPSEGGVVRVVIVFPRVLKLSVRTLEPLPVPLGGWLIRPRSRPIRNFDPPDSVMF